MPESRFFFAGCRFGSIQLEMKKLFFILSYMSFRGSRR
jgi:hypothetical protein